MDISALIDLAGVGSHPGRLEIGSVEPVSVPDPVAVGLAGILSELLQKGAQASTEVVRITSRTVPDGYRIEVSNRESRMSREGIDRMNSILEEPESVSDLEPSESWLTLVARIAARYGLLVSFQPDSSGVTAAVLVPARDVGGDETLIPQGGHTARAPQTAAAHKAKPAADRKTARPRLELRTEEEKAESEAFLEGVFAQLLGTAPRRETGTSPVGSPDGSADGEPGTTVGESTRWVSPSLRQRVPGVSYGEGDEDTPHTMPGEAAVEIQTALANYDRGRRSATLSAER